MFAVAVKQLARLRRDLAAKPRGNRLPLASCPGRWGRGFHTGPDPGRRWWELRRLGIFDRPVRHQHAITVAPRKCQIPRTFSDRRKKPITDVHSTLPYAGFRLSPGTDNRDECVYG